MASAGAPLRISIHSLLGRFSPTNCFFYLERLGAHAKKWVTWRRKERRCESQSEFASAVSLRRASPRIPLQQAVTVQFTSGGHYQFTGISRDISESGIFVLMETSVIEVGSHVEIMLTLPSRIAEPIPIHVKGKVVRIDKPSPAGIAVAFDTLVVAPTVAGSNSLASGN